MKTSSGRFQKISMLYLVLVIFLVPKTDAQNISDSFKFETCIEKKLQQWIKFLREFNDEFDVSDLQFKKKGILKYQTRLLWDSVQSSGVSDKPFCFFSPDSSKMADIYSYSHRLKALPDGKVSIVGGEPDTQVKLIDLVKDSIYTFLTSGTPTEYQDGCWCDSSTLIVAGCNETTELNTYYPFYFVLDFKNNLVMLYKENTAYKPDVRNYIRYKYVVTD